MDFKKDVFDFAMDWLWRFMGFKSGHKEFSDYLDYDYMSDDCQALGFDMNYGLAFGEKYGKAASDWEALDKIIDDVDDVRLLGSAIYSHWLNVCHLAERGEDVVSFENMSWFIIALRRLVMLTDNREDVPIPFAGKIQRIKIYSNSIGFGRRAPDDEVEQHLSITSDGCVFFSSYLFGNDYGRHLKKNETRKFKVEIEKVQHILTCFEQHFSKHYVMLDGSDMGSWAMEIINNSGEIYEFKGPLAGEMLEGGVELSDLVRDELAMPNLYVFDKNR